MTFSISAYSPLTRWVQPPAALTFCCLCVYPKGSASPSMPDVRESVRPWVDVGGVAVGNNSTELRLSEGWARLVPLGC